MKFEVWERWISIIGGVGTASNGTLTTGGSNFAIFTTRSQLPPSWTLAIICLHYRICSFLMFQTVHLECYQQRSFALKMHQNRWRLQPPLGGAYSAPQDSLAGLRRPTSKGGEAKGEEGMELEGRGRRGTLDTHNVGERLMAMDRGQTMH